MKIILIHLVFFVLNYGLEWLLSWKFGLTKKSRFATALLLANLTTPPILYGLARVFEVFSESFWVLLGAEVMVMFTETMVLYVFYYYHYALAKKEKTKKNKFVKCLLFDQCLIASLTMNVGSFLAWMIAWTQGFFR